MNTAMEIDWQEDDHDRTANNSNTTAATASSAEPETFVYKSQPTDQIPRDTVTHLIIDKSVKTIEDHAFEGCPLLVNVVFNQGLQVIGKAAFNRCSNLKEVIVSMPLISLKKIGNFAFFYCRSLVAVPADLLRHVKEIGSGAFEYCDSLVDLHLPEGLLSISDSLFRLCTALRQIIIPSTVVVIGKKSFYGCKLLETVTLSNNSKLEIIGNGAFQSCQSLQELLALPPTLVSIGNVAFCQSSIAHIQLPEGLLILGASAFALCRTLGWISIPSTLRTIASGSFEGCSSLVEVHFKEGLQRIGQRAFAKCPRISAIALPQSLCFMEDGAFSDCDSLLGVELPILHTALQMALPPTSIGNVPMLQRRSCFADCNNLVNVCIPINMNHSAEDAFSDCDKLLLDQNQHHHIDAQQIVSLALQPSEKLRRRFVNLPIHEVCYYASTMTVDDLSLALEASSPFSSSEALLTDPFGMTPLHIVSTSTRLRGDMMRILLYHLPVNCLWTKDKHGRTVMDYLLFHNSKRAVPLIKMVLQKAIKHELNDWGIDERWMSDFCRCVEEIPCDYDVKDSRQHVDSLIGRLTQYLRIEVTSIVELAVWKGAIVLCDKEQEKDQAHQHRTGCRMRCGSNIVLGNVIEYLWDNESETSLSSSFVPLSSSLYDDERIIAMTELVEEMRHDY
ncbi:unnamed protein product [Cylindrotheca closterium]|uniref:Uncharacterized protein n=1 Tax=Cylindrotheca closterium TaxID=2856 RepID=A0AAD2CU71_9STRA|nr:unnamed protein product [Cylindrotheca closterium]